MALRDSNLNKWTLFPSCAVSKRTLAWALTSKNNEFLSWLDNWRYNEGERQERDEERDWKCVCVCVRECPIFFVIALGAGHIHPQHCNLLFTPLPGKKVSWAQIQSVSCDTIVIFIPWQLWEQLCHFPKCAALRCLSSCINVDCEYINYC